MKNSLKIKRMVGIAILAAIVIVLQVLSNYVQFGAISITLALIPIAVGAILYGPIAGVILGALMGVIVLTAPSTQAYFFVNNPWATIFLCLLKTGIAGFVAGLLFKLFAHFAKKTDNTKKKNVLFAIGIIAATLIIPVINTSLFIGGAALFFLDSVYGGSTMAIITGVFTTNFLIEFIVSAVLSPAIVTLIKVLVSKNDLGFTNDFDEFIDYKDIEDEIDDLEEIEDLA